MAFPFSAESVSSTLWWYNVYGFPPSLQKARNQISRLFSYIFLKQLSVGRRTTGDDSGEAGDGAADDNDDDNSDGARVEIMTKTGLSYLPLDADAQCFCFYVTALAAVGVVTVVKAESSETTHSITAQV